MSHRSRRPLRAVHQDVVYDISEYGDGELHGLAALRRICAERPGDQPIGHHVTNIVVEAIDDHSARVRSKGIAIIADGTAGSANYDDVVVRTPEGWRINFRKISAGDRGSDHPLTAPAVSPSVRNRWPKAYIRTTGMLINSEAAAS